MKFTYAITDAAGAVVKEGKENLPDLNYLQTPGIGRTDALFYDKALLRDWLRQTLKKCPELYSTDTLNGGAEVCAPSGGRTIATAYSQ